MAPRERKSPEPPKGAPAFMTTWGDMCTLLLCFFVMLLAMSTIDPAKFNVAASSFQNALSGVLESYPSVMITKDILIPRLGGDEQNKRMAVDAALKIREVVRKEGLEDAVKVKVTESGIAVKLSDPIGFDIGESEIKPELIPTLKSICEIINRVPSTQIRVEGHTDDLPIKSYKFPSNWELSSSRALNVVKFMASSGRIEPSRLSAIGYGEYRPLVPNTSVENRKMNRRIEIFVDYLKKDN
ncbi:MAG: flagellar motor protein MotB [Fibrobacter sp.]|jgi:chemotaxis protein MotB|nr:flagellar motor protein MotB [Fibrobacter sp.]